MSTTEVLAPPLPTAETAADELELPPRPKQWTKFEFYELTDRGAFDDVRVYLYHGQLIEVPTMGPRHATGIKRITVWLVRTLDPEFAVRVQIPFELPSETVFLPDGAVVSLADDARLPHPNRATFVIEVADSSVEIDRDKAFEYAAALVPDYWLMNMRDREVEVFRDPVADPTTPTKFRYASRRVYREGESVAPLARPNAAVAVSALVAAPR